MGLGIRASIVSNVSVCGPFVRGLVEEEEVRLV